MGVKTIKEHIRNYAEGKYYFHIKDLKKHFFESNIEYKEDSIIKSLYRMKKNKVIFKAGRGWYSTIKEEFALDTKPIKRIIKIIEERFPLLKFSCWSTKQIRSYFHHLPSHFVTYVNTDKDYLQSLKDFLTDNGYNTYQNPRKIETEKYVEINKRTVILRPSISYREPKDKNYAKIEKILVDLLVETKRINLTDMEEYKRVISNIITKYRINIAIMLNYAHQMKIRDRIHKIIIGLIVH